MQARFGGPGRCSVVASQTQLFSREEFRGRGACQRSEVAKVGTAVRWGRSELCESAGIGRCTSGQAEPKQMHEIGGGTRGMGAAAQIPQAVQPLDGQGQAGEQPSDQ